MTSEVEEILKNISRIIHGWQDDQKTFDVDAEEFSTRLQKLENRFRNLEKFLLTIEDYDKRSE